MRASFAKLTLTLVLSLALTLALALPRHEAAASALLDGGAG